MVDAPTILLFDSGLGGLTVFREVRVARPDASFVYIADDAGFPYGNRNDESLITRVLDVLGRAIAEYDPDLVIIACNTASTIALSELRARFEVPFVGTVPAIKPACAQSSAKRIAVLGTQGTVSREYTRALIREFASGCDVHLVGSPLYHTAPLVFAGVSLHVGHTLVVMEKWTPEDSLAVMARHRVTTTHMVPTQFHRLLALPEEVKRRYDLSSLRQVIHAAAPCPVDVKRRMLAWWGPVIYEYYAASEGGGTIVTPEEWLRYPGTVGRARPGRPT